MIQSFEAPSPRGGFFHGERDFEGVTKSNDNRRCRVKSFSKGKIGIARLKWRSLWKKEDFNVPDGLNEYDEDYSQTEVIGDNSEEEVTKVKREDG